MNQEEEVLELMESARATLETVEGQSSCLLDQGAVASTKELLQVSCGLTWYRVDTVL